jgi:hypothetical protein
VSGSRGGGGAPESTEAKWLTFLVLLAVIGLAIWFAARWRVVVPIPAWAILNYAAEVIKPVDAADAHGAPPPEVEALVQAVAASDPSPQPRPRLGRLM